MEHILDWVLGARADIFFTFGLLLAGLVTVHVLLTKRDVAASVGWIGLSWIAPFFGSAIYYLMGVNRVRRRARKQRPPRQRREPRTGPPAEGDERSALQMGIGRITRRALTFGNTVRVLQDGDEAYPPMLDAIDAARHTVGLTSYIFHEDLWGGRFIDALVGAHRRGVVVRVLIDGVGGGYLSSPAFHRLQREGVPSGRFLHSLLPWRMPFINLRSHKKVLVVDGRVGFTGGMNISDDNVMSTSPKSPVQDTHFRLEGPIVGQLAEDFLQDWEFATDEALDDPSWFPDSDGEGGCPARTIDAGPDVDLEKIESAIDQAIASARHRIAIMTPYFLPDDRLIAALALAAMRGVAVDITVPEKSDHRFVDWATRPNIRPLMVSGVHVWRSPPPFRHSKLMVVDDEWCLIGSSNWDMRSFRLNFELCVEVYDAALAADLQAKMISWRGKPLTRSELAARSLPIRLRDAAARLALPYI